MADVIEAPGATPRRDGRSRADLPAPDKGVQAGLSGLQHLRCLSGRDGESHGSWRRRRASTRARGTLRDPPRRGGSESRASTHSCVHRARWRASSALGARCLSGSRPTCQCGPQGAGAFIGLFIRPRFPEPRSRQLAWLAAACSRSCPSRTQRSHAFGGSRAPRRLPWRPCCCDSRRGLGQESGR